MSMRYVMAQLRNMREKWYKPPKSYHSGNFEYTSLKRSAMNEIIRYLMLNDKRDPMDTVEEFREMMDEKACEANTASANFMFSVYYDVATDVLDMIISWKMRWKEMQP